LVVILMLTLVAPLGTRARADTDTDDGVAVAEGLVSEPVDRARGASPVGAAQTPTDLAADPEGASSHARASTPAGDADAAVEQQQALASDLIAQAELRNQPLGEHDAAAAGGVVRPDTQPTATKEQRGQGTQDESRRTAAAVTAGSENPATQAAATEDERDHAGQDDTPGKAATCADDCSQQPPTPPTPPVPRNLAAAPPPNEPEGNPDENDAFNYFVEELAGRPLDQQLIEINYYLGLDERTLQQIRDQPYDIDIRAERLLQQVVGALTFIETVLQPQLEGTLQPEAVAAQVAAARARAEELLRQIDEDLPVISAMTDPNAAQEAVERWLMDSEIALMEREVSRSVAARDRASLGEHLEGVQALQSQAQENEWAEQHAQLLALQARVQEALRTLGNPMSAATVAPPLTSEHAQGQRPVAIPPPPGSGGSKWDAGIPPAVAVTERVLDVLDPYGDQPQVVKPIPPSLPTPDKDVNPGLWARLNEKFEHAPKPDPTTIGVGVLGLSAAALYVLSRTQIGQLILLFSSVPENSLKGIPPTVSGAARPG